MKQEKEMKIKEKEEYKQLVRPLTEVEYVALKSSIEKHGLRYPITLNKQGTILDGYHRYKICKELGIEPKIQVVHVKPEEEKDFIRETNFRRSFNDFEMIEGCIQTGTLSIRKTAKELEMGKSTIHRASKVISEGSEGLKKLVREEKLSIYGAYKLVTALEDVPEKTKKELEERVTSATDPQEELVKVLDIIGETNKAKGYLEMTSQEVAKEIEPLYKDAFYTEDLDAEKVHHDIQVAEGVQPKLKKAYLPIDKFKDEVQADEYAKKFSGRCLGKVTVEMWVVEVDPFEWEERRKKEE